MQRKLLEIPGKLESLEGMPDARANLGLIYETRGETDEPRRLRTKARDLYEKIGMSHMVEKVQA